MAIVSSPQNIHHAVTDLYVDHHGWLIGWLRKKLGCPDTAADLAHDTYVRLIAGRSQLHFESIAETRAYLRTMANNLCVDRWRRQEIERAWLDTLAMTQEEFYPSAERQAMVLQALEEISVMLQSLAPKAARAFILAVVCEMTDDEVGAELGVSGRTVRNYVAQAMLGCLTLRARDIAAELRQESTR